MKVEKKRTQDDCLVLLWSLGTSAQILHLRQASLVSLLNSRLQQNYTCCAAFYVSNFWLLDASIQKYGCNTSNIKSPAESNFTPVLAMYNRLEKQGFPQHFFHVSSICLHNSRWKKLKTSLDLIWKQPKLTMWWCKINTATWPPLLATRESQDELHFKSKQHGLTTTHRSSEKIKGFFKNSDALITIFW